jgi:hypothetical protein
MTSGCKVRTNTPVRQSGTPIAVNLSQSCPSTSSGCWADRAPSISQLAMSLVVVAAIALLSGASRSGQERDGR